MRSLVYAGAKPSLRAVAGFACNQGFAFSLFYMGANRAFGVVPVAFERADLFGTLLFMILAFALFRIASPKARSALLTPLLLWCYAALLVVASLVPLLPGTLAAGDIILESVFIGLPSGLMLVAWGRILGGRAIAHSVPEVFLGSALGATVCFAFAAIPLDVAPLVLKLLPLGSAWALCALTRNKREGSKHRYGGGGATIPSVVVRAMSEDTIKGGEEVVVTQLETQPLSLRVLLSTSEEREETARLSMKMAAGTVLFGLAAGFMETYGSDPGMASTPTIPATLLLFVVFCVAALQLLTAARLGSDSSGNSVLLAATEAPQGEQEGPLDDVYRLAILVMMAGFLFVPVLGEFGVPGEAIVLAGYLGLSAVLVSLFLVMAYITGQDAAQSFARGFTALFAGEVSGIALGNAIDAFAGFGETPYVVVACAGLAALFAYLFLFTERDFRALSVIARDADRFEDACVLITSRFGLSKREAEILPFALKGRTGERIASEFFISKSTVDTHLRRTYAKCGVHGRQELIDLGESIVRQLDGS
ncbi:MAG: LuxR C-terminal-related transcriptional regulator [Gordonibacter sp.]|nr:LuxR C-terminal-related transcriptional regulator [Gordonibacter sp.]